MTSEHERMSEKDPLRLCPECRMPISILANRCRFCGAAVGKPRKEVETLTVQDLGGEDSSTYTVSGNVMEALKSFMTEEQAAAERAREEEERKASWLGRKRTGQDTPKEESGLPPLDPMHSGLADLGARPATPSQIKARKQAAARSREIGRKVFLFGAITAGLVILFLGTNFAVARIKEMRARNTPEGFVYPNKALEMLASGTPSVECVEEALTALRHNDTPENRAILEKVRLQVISEVEAGLGCVPFSQEKLDKASALINRVGMMDSDPKTTQLLDRVNRELAYFKFVLTSTEGEGGKAVFRLNNSYLSEKEQTVAEGELLQDRFLVKKVGSTFVRLEDTKVASENGTPRTLMARTMSPVSSM
ncbi:MAG TPA: hypothetical protein P5141_03665 [Candidatus Hydrogenedentes bacterium]|nr:hypothetical protein [Candidatus Hydrogenedentota bacterium]